MDVEKFSRNHEIFNKFSKLAFSNAPYENISEKSLLVLLRINRPLDDMTYCYFQHSGFLC